MKTSNLMQGDWVRTNDGELRKVVTIDVGYVSLEDGDNILTKSDEHIFPIEITEDILERNGFEKHSGAFGSETWEYSGFGEKGTNNEFDYLFLTRISFNEKRHTWGLDVSVYGEGSGRFFIDHVHELQQIMRKCKIKKEVRL